MRWSSFNNRTPAPTLPLSETKPIKTPHTILDEDASNLSDASAGFMFLTRRICNSNERLRASWESRRILEEKCVVLCYCYHINVFLNMYHICSTFLFYHSKVLSKIDEEGQAQFKYEVRRNSSQVDNTYHKTLVELFVPPYPHHLYWASTTAKEEEFMFVTRPLFNTSIPSTLRCLRGVCIVYEKMKCSEEIKSFWRMK